MVHMQDELLPLFPLQVVLFPRTALPLHIFEERYKEMIGDVLRGHTEFGVVLAGEKGIVNTGCTATVEKVLKNYPDGRMDLLTVGRRRFEIILLNDEKPYLRGRGGVLRRRASRSHCAGGPQARDRRLQRPARAGSIPATLHEPETERSAAELPTGAGGARPGLPPDSAGDAIGSRSDAAPGRVFPSYGSRQRQIQHARAVAPTQRTRQGVLGNLSIERDANI